MNITEFAAYAGVSKAAVSRFFNGGYLSAEKKAAIAKAVEETGYRPSMHYFDCVHLYAGARSCTGKLKNSCGHPGAAAPRLQLRVSR